MKFIEAEQVPELEAVIHLVVASSDTRHSVATAADLELKSKQRYKFGCLEKMMLVFITKLAAISVVLRRDCSERKKAAVPHVPVKLPCIHMELGMVCLSLAAGNLALELTALAVCFQSSLVLLLSYFLTPWFQNCPLWIVDDQ